MNLKDTYTSVFLQAADKPVDKETIKKYRSVWWVNSRTRDNRGLQLTDHALSFITDDAHIKTYSIPFPSDFKFTPQILIWLHRFIDSPYYVTKKNIIVLSERAAFELYLYSGDIKKLGYSKALSKRRSQESAEVLL